jgi:hypothetical protein
LHRYSLTKQALSAKEQALDNGPKHVASLLVIKVNLNNVALEADNGVKVNKTVNWMLQCHSI